MNYKWTLNHTWTFIWMNSLHLSCENDVCDKEGPCKKKKSPNAIGLKQFNYVFLMFVK
jgi:hypothetical protein